MVAEAYKLPRKSLNAIQHVTLRSTGQHKKSTKCFFVSLGYPPLCKIIYQL